MIEEKAQELGRLIGQSPEHQVLRRAEKTLQEDSVTRGRLEKIDQLARKIDELVAQKKMPDEATMLEYETAVRDLETSPEGQAYVVARANYEKLMSRVNQQMSLGIERGASSSIITLA
ncbi:MAG TPA: YlbF family regulator [Gemmatimonadales bacterium]|nr:YlbF family regulator [Gemmatimonadales bacterium]